MTITLGSVTINDNMYLNGIESSQQIAFSQRRTLSGMPVTNISVNVGGRALTLGSQNSNGIQGIWLKSVINSVKTLEALGQSVTLSYRGSSYTVLIVGTEFEPYLQYETESDNKQFTGSVNLLEV